MGHRKVYRDGTERATQRFDMHHFRNQKTKKNISIVATGPEHPEVFSPKNHLVLTIEDQKKKRVDKGLPIKRETTCIIELENHVAPDIPHSPAPGHMRFTSVFLFGEAVTPMDQNDVL